MDIYFETNSMMHTKLTLMNSILNTLVQGNSDQFQSGSSFKSSFLEFTLSFALDGRLADLANRRREKEREGKLF